MSDLRSIVYASTAVKLMSEEELEALLLEARKFNLDNGITGVLIYSDGNFMQCIEGPHGAVATAYGRIQASEKHRGIIELVEEDVPDRNFRDWQMGFKRARKSELLALSSAKWQGQLDGAPATSSGMLLLKNFWAQPSR